MTATKGKILLHRLTEALGKGSIKVVDLTETMRHGSPTIVMPPEFDQPAPFRREPISIYDEGGPAWYWNNIVCSEQTGTHFDAPIHWITGRDLPASATDTITPEKFVAPACVVDCSAEAANDADFLLTCAHLLEWEARHGRIRAGSWLLMRTD